MTLPQVKQRASVELPSSIPPGGDVWLPGTPVSFSYDGLDTNPIPWLIPIPLTPNVVYSFQATVQAANAAAIPGTSNSLLANLFGAFWRNAAGVLQGAASPNLVATPPLEGGTPLWIVLAGAWSGDNLVVEFYPNAPGLATSIRAQGMLASFVPSFNLGTS